MNSTLNFEQPCSIIVPLKEFTYKFANIFDRKLKDINNTNVGNKKQTF